jgi:hypothetical protein
MAESYRYPPEKQPARILDIDADGRQIQIGPIDTAAGVIARNPDQSETLRNPSRLATYRAPLVRARPDLGCSTGRAMKLAVRQLLETLLPHQIDQRSREEGAPLGVRAFAFSRVFMTWPRPSDEPAPAPSVMLRRAGPVVYSEKLRQPYFVEGTRGRWAPNTVLRKIARGTGRVHIVAWAADTEQHEAIEAAIEDTFLAEPSEDLPGRRIIVPGYFDQQARLTLIDSDDETDESLVRENRWPLVVTVQVEIDRVILVSTPPTAGDLIGGEIGGDVEITT